MLSLAREAVARMADLGAFIQTDAPMLSAHLSRNETPEVMAKVIRKISAGNLPSCSNTVAIMLTMTIP